MRPAGTVATVSALAGYAWWASGLQPFTTTCTAAVVGSGVVAMVVGSRRRRPPTAGLGARDLAGWAALGALLTAWQLAAYVQHPRAEHPTLSFLANQLLDTHPVRALAFGTWLAGAARLASR